EVNDIGFQYRADRCDAQASDTYVEPRPGSVLRTRQTNATLRAERNHAGETIMNRGSAYIHAPELNYWTYFLSSSYSGEALDDRLTRGGPSSRRPAQVQLNSEISSDSRRTVSGWSGVNYARHDAGGWGAGFTLGLNVRPSPSWSISASPRYE